jgi:hypothetical protein
LKQQNQRLRAFTLMRKKGLDTRSIREPTTQRFILLKQAMKVFQKIVPEDMVPASMSTDAFEAFFFLYEVLDVNFNKRLQDEDFTKIVKALESCASKNEAFSVEAYTNSCPKRVSEPFM